MIRPRLPHAATVINVLRAGTLLFGAIFAALVAMAVIVLGLTTLVFAAGEQHFVASLLMGVLLDRLPDALIAMGLTGIFVALLLIAVPYQERRG